MTTMPQAITSTGAATGGPIPARTSRLTGIAAIGYAVGAGVENMDVLGAPRLGSPTSDIRVAFLDGATGSSGVVAGGLALGLFVMFAIGLRRRLAAGGAPAWAGLAGGILGPILATVGLIADAVLVDRVTGLADAEVRGLFEIHPRLQLLSGPFVAAFLGSGLAGLRTGGLPPRLARSACVLGAPLRLVPFAVLDPRTASRRRPSPSGSACSLWVFATGVWLVLQSPIRGDGFARRVVFLVLVVRGRAGRDRAARGAGRHGDVLLVGLAPPPLAAFAGGAYLGSAAVYACALTLGRVTGWRLVPPGSG